MVGTGKWKPEWVACIHAAKKDGKTIDEIVNELHARFPRGGKDYKAGGVKYVLANYKDPTLIGNQVLGGGVKKRKKSTKASQISVGAKTAMNNVRMGSPVTSVASSLDHGTQPRRPVAGGSMAAIFETPRPLNTLSSANSLAPGNMLRAAVAGVNSSYNFPGAHIYPEGSFDHREAHQSAATTAGVSKNNLPTIDDDGYCGAHQSMQRPSSDTQNNVVSQGREQVTVNPYTMDSAGLAQYRQQQYGQPLNGQIQAATNDPMAPFMNAQANQVTGGIRNVPRVGLGQGVALNPNGSIMQNVHAQFNKQKPSQALPQVQQTSNGLPTANVYFTNPNIASNIARTVSPNHGHPNHQNDVSGGNAYTGSNQPTSRQDTSGAYGAHRTIGRGNVTTNAAVGGRQHGTPEKSSGAQNSQPPSSLKTHRPRDGFDFDEDEDFLDSSFLGFNTAPLDNSASTSRNEPQRQIEMGIAATQTGSKRKRQEEEPVRIQMSAVEGSSNSVNPYKRQKQDSLESTMANLGGQKNNVTAIQRPPILGNVRNGGNVSRTFQKPNFTSNGQPQSQVMQNPAATNTKMQAANMANKRVYDPILLQKYQANKGGRTPEQELALINLNMKTLVQAQGDRLNAEQVGDFNRSYQVVALDMESLRSHSLATAENRNQPQLGDGHPRESARGGMPQATISLEEQKNHHKILQEKLVQNSNGGGPRVSEGRTGYSQHFGNNSMNNISNRQTSSIINGASIPPTFQATPNVTRVDMFTSQHAHVNGHRFNVPPSYQATPNIDQAAMSTSHQWPNSANGTEAVSHPRLPTNTNRALTTPAESQSHGVNRTLTPAGSQPTPNIPRPNTVPAQVARQTTKIPYSNNSMQQNTHNQASAPMEKSTSLPPPDARPSASSRVQANLQPPTVMQPPPIQEGQGQSRYHGAQAFNGPSGPVNTSRTGAPSTTNGPCQSPYPSNAGIGSQVAPNQPQKYDQRLHQAVNGAVTNGTSAPVQKAGVKSPSSASKSGNASDQTSSPTTVSPNTTSSNGASSAIISHVLGINNAVFHDHFTFPTSDSGWQVILDHNERLHTVLHPCGTVVILDSPVFLGGVTWPTGREPPVQNPAATLPVSNNLPSFVAQASSSLAPPTQNAAVTNHVSGLPPVSVPRSTGPPPPAHQVPIALGATQSSMPKPVSSMKADRKKPDLQLDLKDVSPKTAMRKAGPIRDQTEQGLPELLVEKDDDLSSLFGDDDDLGGLFGDDHDPFGEGADDNQNVPDPSASALSGDQTSKPSLGLASPSPVANSTQQGGGNAQSFLDNAQPTVRESSAPKSILQNPNGPPQGGNINQSSADQSSRHVQFDEPKADAPKPEDDILTDVNAAEWRARHPIPKMPNHWEKKASLPAPVEKKASEVPERMTDESPERVAENIRLQTKWLKSIFPDYPKLDRLDVMGLDRPLAGLDFSELVGSYCETMEEAEEAVGKVEGREDWNARGDPEVAAALKMMAYVVEWGELCTKFDKNGNPMMKASPDPSRKEFNKRMAEEIYQEKKARKEAEEAEEARWAALVEERFQAMTGEKKEREIARCAAVEKERAAYEEEDAKKWAHDPFWRGMLG
ncbi:hypothetical protein BKA65DRAFT_95511 [Rhexocercosporidium sp. MPI-PUGE-AT-0058]|nr:hypothetical protein BKA65DRAFT_95511 [Rhexocercosporidium sp. MPI-PUGE-AT-0058]